MEHPDGDDALFDKAHILMAQIFLADIADFEGMNSVWDDWVALGDAPPRATVQAAGLPRGVRVEIECVAAVTG